MKEILLPYQQRWIADRAPVKVCEKSRRIGITWAEAADAALDAAGRNGTDWWYIGYNKDMAREFIEDAAGWARRFNQAARAIEEIAIEDEDKDILAFRIRFASGNKIVALSSRPSNLRGKQGVAVIDEAAFHDSLRRRQRLQRTHRRHSCGPPSVFTASHHDRRRARRGSFRRHQTGA